MIQLVAAAISVAAVLFSPPAQAGSRMFQPAIGHYVDTILLDTGNSSDLSLHADFKKRALTFDPNSGDPDTPARWANGVVLYCWAEVVAEAVFGEFIRDGLALWHAAGLPDKNFDFQLSKDCNDQTKRANYLLISQGAYLATTVGLTSSASGDGPKMVLSTDSSLGHLNVLANVAHEMGHAWGLYHEHQNRYFWDAAYAEGGGNIFGTAANPFHCQNLRDYAAVRNQVLVTRANNNAAEADRLMAAEYCKYRGIAAGIEFSAMNYLPLTTEATLTPAGDGFDVESIMLYPTGAGGIVQNGARLPILGKQDGSPILPVLKPSARDVDGLKKLYGIKETSKFNPLGARGNPLKTLFDAVRNRDKDSGCV